MNIKWDRYSWLKYDRCTQNTIQPWHPLLHLGPTTPRWWICVTIRHRHLHPMEMQRMVLQTSHSAKYWWRCLVGQWLGICWFLGWQTSDMRLARRKLGKKIHPDHGGRRRPMATMAPRSRRWGITKLANTLRDKSVPLNLEYIFIINICVAILVTTLCERADDHGGCCRPTAALWPHSRRYTALRNHTKKTS